PTQIRNSPEAILLTSRRRTPNDDLRVIWKDSVVDLILTRVDAALRNCARFGESMGKATSLEAAGRQHEEPRLKYTHRSCTIRPARNGQWESDLARSRRASTQRAVPEAHTPLMHNSTCTKGPTGERGESESR